MPADPPARLLVVCAGLWLAAKLLAVAVGPGRGPWRRELFWWFWPGLERRRFFAGSPGPPPRSEWLRGTGCAVGGAGLFLLGGVLTGRGAPLVGGACAAVGFVFGLHFGLFHLLALTLRTQGIDAVPLMNRPLSAATLAEFWGRRWNTAFAFLTRDAVFAPLAERLGVGPALWAGFLLSGVVHEVALTLPVWDSPGVLYGGPTGYFLLQAAGLTAERRWRKAGRLRGGGNRAFAAAVLVVPLPLLVSGAFLTGAAGPLAGAASGAVGGCLSCLFSHSDAFVDTEG